MIRRPVNAKRRFLEQTPVAIIAVVHRSFQSCKIETALRE